MKPEELAQRLQNMQSQLESLEVRTAALHAAVVALIQTHPQYNQFQLALARLVDSGLAAQLMLKTNEQQHSWLMSLLEEFQKTNAAPPIDFGNLLQPKP